MNTPNLNLDNSLKIMYYGGVFLFLFVIYDMNQSMVDLRDYRYKIDSLRFDRELDSAELANYNKLNKNPIATFDEKREVLSSKGVERLKELKLYGHFIQKSKDKIWFYVWCMGFGVILVLLSKKEFTRREKLQDDLLSLQYKILMLEYENKINPPKNEPRYIAR